MSLKEDIRDDVSDAVEEYVEKIRTSVEEEVPTTEIHVIQDSGITFLKSEEVAKPSEVINSANNGYYDGEFREIAERIVECLSLEVPPAADVDREGTKIAFETDEIRIVETRLMEFSGLVMDYAGEIGFQDDVFSEVYENQFYPEYTDREEVEVIIPVSGIVTDTRIELSADFELENEFYGPYQIKNLELGPATEIEKNGVSNFETKIGHSVSPRVAPDFDVNHVLRFRIQRMRPYDEVYQYFNDEPPERLKPDDITMTPVDRLNGGLHKKFIDEILQLTRHIVHLHSPLCNPSFRAAYVAVPGYLWFRGIAIDIVDKHPIESYGDSDGVLALVESQTDPSEFRSFWERYAPVLTDMDSQYGKPVRRYEEMFRKVREEDRILDCVIALEKTLLTESDKSGSYTFKIGLRSCILLSDVEFSGDLGTEDTFEFARDLYRLRGDIVHQDISIISILNEEDRDTLTDYSSPHHLVEEARVLLANLILRYLDLQIDHGLSIHGSNEALNEAVRSASFDPADYAIDG